MNIVDIGYIHTQITGKARQLLKLSRNERVKIMVPLIGNLFNTINEFRDYTHIGLREHNTLCEIVEVWIDYLAFHNLIIRVPCVPLFVAPAQTPLFSDSYRRNSRKIRYGKVVSHSGVKTVKVECEYSFKHPKYKKYVKKTKCYLVHDEKELACIGDMVEIVECRPLSKRKHHRLSSILIQSNISRDRFL